MEITKRIIAIGGGEIRSKETLEIDGYIDRKSTRLNSSHVT